MEEIVLPVGVSDVMELPYVALRAYRSLPSDKAGVYFAVACGSDPRILYIGMTQRSFYERWCERDKHHRFDELMAVESVGSEIRLYLLCIDDISVIPDIEDLLINRLKPPLNRSLPFIKRSLQTQPLKEFISQSHDHGWILEGIIPVKGVVMLCSDWGVGKTTVAYNMIYALGGFDSVMSGECIPFGSSILSGFYRPTPTLLIQTDETITNSVSKLKDIGFDRFDHNHVDVVTDWQFDQLDLIEEWIEHHNVCQPCLVVIDSLTSCHSMMGLDENAAAYSSQIYRLRDLANKYDVAFLVLHHTAKNGSKKTPRGSSAIGGAFTDVWLLHRDDDEDLSSPVRKMTPLKQRSNLLGEFGITIKAQSKIDVSLNVEQNERCWAIGRKFRRIAEEPVRKPQKILKDSNNSSKDIDPSRISAVNP